MEGKLVTRFVDKRRKDGHREYCILRMNVEESSRREDDGLSEMTRRFGRGRRLKLHLLLEDETHMYVF